MTTDRQDALVQDLAGVVLSSLDLAETWAAVSATFSPHGQGWAGRVVITDRDDSVRGSDAAFAADSQTSLLLDALRRTAGEEEGAVLSFRMDASRTEQQPERIRLETEFVHAQDPGSLDGPGGA